MEDKNNIATLNISIDIKIKKKRKKEIKEKDFYLQVPQYSPMYGVIYAPKGKHKILGRTMGQTIVKEINVQCLPLKSQHKRFKHSVRTFIKKKSCKKKIINFLQFLTLQVSNALDF